MLFLPWCVICVHNRDPKKRFAPLTWYLQKKEVNCALPAFAFQLRTLASEGVCSTYLGGFQLYMRKDQTMLSAFAFHRSPRQRGKVCSTCSGGFKVYIMEAYCALPEFAKAMCSTCLCSYRLKMSQEGKLCPPCVCISVIYMIRGGDVLFLYQCKLYPVIIMTDVLYLPQ